MLTTMQGLVENEIYVSYGKIPIFVGGAAYQWIFAWRLSLPHGLIYQ